MGRVTNSDEVIRLAREAVRLLDDNGLARQVLWLAGRFDDWTREECAIWFTATDRMRSEWGLK